MLYTTELQQLIISSILGDGSFTKKGANRNSKLSVAHCIQQRELIEYKHKILLGSGLANSICYNRIRNPRYKKGYIEEYRFKSKPHEIFTAIREECYIDGRKRVVPKHIQGISPLGLALWYMDDGNVTNDSFQINTQSFSDEEKFYLQMLLKDKYNVKCSVHKQGQLYIFKESSENFIKLVKPYMLNSMLYKVIPYNKRVLYKSGELQER